MPVRYLGIPLVTKKLTEKDFDPLVQKMKYKLESCGSRHLSYGLQLVQSMIYNFQIFRCKHFLIPVGRDGTRILL